MHANYWASEMEQIQLKFGHFLKEIKFIAELREGVINIHRGVKESAPFAHQMLTPTPISDNPMWAPPPKFNNSVCSF